MSTAGHAMSILLIRWTLQSSSSLGDFIKEIFAMNPLYPLNLVDIFRCVENLGVDLAKYELLLILRPICNIWILIDSPRYYPPSFSFLHVQRWFSMFNFLTNYLNFRNVLWNMSILHGGSDKSTINLTLQKHFCNITACSTNHSRLCRIKTLHRSPFIH